MKIINKRTGKTLAESIIETKSTKNRMLGLLAYEKPHALLIKTHFGIHTFGMKYRIDVLILNNQNKVVAMNKRMKPNRVFFWNPKYKTVIELPNGLIEKSKTNIGDLMDIT